MNTKQRSRGGTTAARLGVSGQANSVGTVKELTLLFLTNQSYTRKELRKACDEGLKTFIEFMK